MTTEAERPPKYTGVAMRVHPSLRTYLLQRQVRDSHRLQRHVSLSELTETLARELSTAASDTTTPNTEATANDAT